jgi:TonB-dependent Receptor Plug Domain
MTTRRLVSLLLLSSALCAPTFAYAQDTTSALQGAAVGTRGAPAQDEQPDISIPGVSEIVVMGRRNITQSASQVISVLSTEAIARTGEGNIAGALNRVTGLSLVGSGYVYIRGLGDRYSLALLNGSPLPSPEPLKRVVPLDLFPSSIIASTLVQKSYSSNFPGEFGGGVINLTTRAAPQDGFVSLGIGISGDSETTNNLGYSYYGSKTDWSGYDNGNRDIPSALTSYLSSGQRISSGKIDTATIASQLVNGRNGLVQRIGHVKPNASFSLSAGKSFEMDSYTLGVIAAGGYNDKWTTRDTRNQQSLSSDLSVAETDFRRVRTDERIVANGLLGVNLEFGENTVRWTNVYIHDTIKHTRFGLGKRQGTTVDYLRQDTAWYERQLVNSQVVGEFRPTDALSIDVRASYAETGRKAPFELTIEYNRTNVARDPYGQYFINRLNNGNNGDARISFSDLNERLGSGGVDVSYKFTETLAATVGYAYSDTLRNSSRRDFQFSAPNTLPGGVDMFRPDLLLQPSIIKNFGISLVETNEGNPAFLATLKNHAGYVQVNGQIYESLKYNVGARYETATQDVSPVQVFTTPGASLAATNLNNNYILPAATLTLQLQDKMQVRVSGSQTLARPQFRELIYQFYFDPDTNRMYRGNPLLVDSKLTNAEARYEWYFAANQQISTAAFYKSLTDPIESYVAGDLTTSFANAPKAVIMGVEFEAEKRFDLVDMPWEYLASRRFLLRANYTFSKSELTVGASDGVSVFAASSKKASDFFKDGAPLTGQSDHVANIELGFENPNRLSQQTLMINYNSKRVTSRGLANSGQPDVFEYPGVRIDLVAREGFELFGREIEIKIEARNLTGQTNEEYQKAGENRIDVNSYKVGRSVAVSSSVKF